MVRAHRLWERYLADETGYQPLAWHELADQMEHRLTPAAANALAATLGNPTYDPHGDPIPSAEGDVLVNRRPTADRDAAAAGRAHRTPGRRTGCGLCAVGGRRLLPRHGGSTSGNDAAARASVGRRQ
ncbi:MAG: hypothetical protein IPO15_02505 [Anaerolineae bacterium]|nr:hypothetical protein [Anaerolineae bacterium]